MQLNELSVGNSAVISKMNVKGHIAQRLIDLGLIEGTKIECVLKGPFGDPCAYRVRGTLLALRKCDAKDICVSSDGEA